MALEEALMTEVNDIAAKSAEQDDPARTCRLILV